MLRITPIGSCRVAGPLQLAQDRLGYAVNKSRSYGYCHSSGEAVQLVRFLMGQFKPPADIWPLVARGVKQEDLAHQTHDPSDFYIIELSSAKRITVDGIFVQLNYLTNAYRDIFGDPETARKFWDAAARGDQCCIDDYLDQHALVAEDRKILRRVRIGLTTPKQLNADIRALRDLLPRVAIVTHVDARKPDGSSLSTRSDFIAMVKDAARAQSVSVYDPTRAMHEMGQHLAMSDQDTGLAHYTDAFANELADDWDKLFIQPAVDEMAQDALFVPHVRARLAQGKFQEMRPRLSKLLRDRPNDATLHTLKRDLDGSVVEAENTFKKQQSAEAAFNLERFDELADTLAKTAHPPSPRRMLQMAQSTIEAGKSPAALCILDALLKAQPGHAIAGAVMADILLAGDRSVLKTLADAVRERLLAAVNVPTQIKLSDAGGWENSASVRGMTSDDILEITAYLTLQSDIPRAAAMLTDWRTAHARSLPKDISTMLDRWCALVADAKNSTSKLSLVRAILAVDPKHTQARDILRDIRRNLRSEMREAVARSDQKHLDDLVAPNALLPVPLKELDLYRARQRFDSGAFEDAIEIGLKTSQAMPDKISVWVLLMRSAAKAGDQTSLRKFAEQVLTLADPETSRLEAEALAHLDRVKIRSLSEAAT